MPSAQRVELSTAKVPVVEFKQVQVTLTPRPPQVGVLLPQLLTVTLRLTSQVQESAKTFLAVKKGRERKTNKKAKSSLLVTPKVYQMIE